MRRLYRVTETVLHKIVFWGGYLSSWLVPIMMVLVFTEVVARYGFRRPLMVADEFSAYMLVTIAFLGTAMTWKERGHVRITALVDILPTRAAAWLRLITLVIALVMAILVTKSSIDYMVRSFSVHMRSSTWLNVPLQGPQLTILIGFILLSLLLLLEIIRNIASIRSGQFEEATK
ncbi:MAG: TRAP transporter small permease [Chloroflexota bacterium]|nr:TRAP transporter small permease [Chloroflexota bacterium]